MVESLTNSVLAAFTGQISPQLIEPGDFKDSLENMRKVNGMLQMPIPIDEAHYFEYLRISNIAIVVSKKRLLFEIRIPILEIDELETYRVIPLPYQLTETTFQFINVPHDYLFVNQMHLS